MSDINRLMRGYFHPLSSETFISSVSPLLLSQHKREVHNVILMPKLKRHFQSSPPAVSHSITGCFR